MSLSDINLRQLECFCAVVKYGSFSKAAAVLSLGQPSLSRQVRKLEDDVGSQLLYRNGRGVALTSTGRRFHENISGLIAKVKSAYEDASDTSASPVGLVTLGLPTSMSALLAVPLLRRLKNEAPNIRLHLVDGFSGHVHEWLLSGRVDLAILHGARHTPAITVEHLISEDLFLIGAGPPQSAGTGDSGPTITMAEVVRLPLFLPAADHGLRRQVNRVSMASGLELNTEADVDSFIAIRELVISRAGFTILPLASVAREIQAGDLKAWRIVQPPISNTMVLAAAQNRPFTRAMAEVRSAILGELARVQIDPYHHESAGDQPIAPFHLHHPAPVSHN